MRSALSIVEQQILEMRWRALSLAADLDRIERGTGGAQALANDPRLETLRAAIKELLSTTPGRAERVQMIFSDRSKEITGDVK